MLPFSHPSQRSRYRSARSVRPQNGSGSNGIGGSGSGTLLKWSKAKMTFFLLAVLAVAGLTVVPIFILEGSVSFEPSSHHRSNHIHPNKMLQWSKAIQHQVAQRLHNSHNNGDPLSALSDTGNAAAAEEGGEDEEEEPPSPLTRGVNRLPMSRTPALIGAQRGHVQCDVPIDEDRIVYWNERQGDRDLAFVSPFVPPEAAYGPDGNKKEYYITFQPDRGGWNNIRMSMEILFVMASATGRTLVLPPKVPYYLLGHGKEGARSFGDFFPLFDNPDLLKKVKLMTMKDFIAKESPSWKGLTDAERQQLFQLSELCLHKPGDELDCEVLHKQLRTRGYQPQIKPTENCYIFDMDVLRTGDPAQLSDDLHLEVDRFCGGHRTPVFYDKNLQTTPFIHWDAGCDSVGHSKEEMKKCFRLLQHFYTFIYFTDPKVDNYYKRFVRDFLHYKDPVYCAAAKVIQAVQQEADKLAVPWSTWHVRRGDLQYKKVKIPAEEWWENTKEVWRPGELLYIATDERDKSFFDPIRKANHPVRFLDDYWDQAGIGKLDSSYVGMVDTIVASHGRAFAGTWFSTFTGYINRLRGYMGKSMKDSWYSFLPRKEVMREFTFPDGNYAAREWQVGWLGIDTDEHFFEEHGVPADDIHDKAVLRLQLPDAPKQEKQAVKYDKIDFAVADLKPDVGFREKPMARLISGRPMDQTPALQGATRGHIECDINVDSLAYWNEPQGERDQNFQSPFAVQDDVKYISFAPDRGGWNNIRMCMEIIFVIAAVTGRTLVLPPKAPLYLLNKDSKSKHRGFADFFPLHTAEFQKRVKVITMEEFVKREGGADGRLPIPPENAEFVAAAADNCDRNPRSKNNCNYVYDYLVSSGHSPMIRAKDSCVVFDEDVYNGRDPTTANKEVILRRCGKREPLYWNKDLQDHTLIHFRASEKEYRLLAHFYGMLYFTNPAIDHYYKRFVRDFLHYHDSIYCAAGKIVKALQAEGEKRGFTVDDEGGGGYSALHVRRGDLQYKKVKIPAEEWWENTKEVWRPGEILYIATDERNKTFFDPIRANNDVRFLDDYFEMAGLKELDPNYMGMIDTIVASRGRAFAGTWFSTFSGYINRLRGYHGMTMMDSWYGWLPRKDALHEWEEVDHFAYAFEWPDCWVGIDADVWPTRDKF